MFDETHITKHFLIREGELIELLKLWATIRFGKLPDGDWLIIEERPGTDGLEMLFRWTAKPKGVDNAN